ncbi:MAG TPA: Rid family hydrolase [Longimicrobiaceae bacterium]|jgi:2-iminobutanoate/2-iminopropanoate deaminase|nr:Rid family hydrolase [Longimicrobiaceae bacterium]
MARSWEPVTLGGVPAPRGAYSPAIRAGDLVFVSGQVPRDPVTGELLGGDVASQTRATIGRLRAVLAEAGAALEDVVSITAYLRDIGDWDEFNQAYREAMPAPYPTRTTVGADLGDVLVEISAIAHVRR